jgi:hypothetical protein
MVHLKERDFEIIDYLKNQGWVLSTQLAKRFFLDSRHSCSNRMRALATAGVVESVALSQYRGSFWHERGILNALCDLSGRTKVFRLSESFRAALGQRWVKQSNDSMLAHQVLLTRVHERLESLIPEATFVSENQEAIKRSLSRETDSYELPDLVLRVCNLRVAVELERKARRGLSTFNFSYENRFENLVRDYDVVLYVLEKEEHIRPLALKAESLRRVGFCSILSFSSIYRANRDVVPLKEFINEFEKARVL